MSEAVSRDAVSAVLAEAPKTQARAAELLSDANLTGRRFDVPAGTNIYEPQTPAKSLYLLHEGEVRVLYPNQGTKQKSVRLLEILGKGDWFGAPALLSGEKTYETRARAITNATVSEVPAERLFAVLPQRPDIATILIRALASKLERAYTEAANLVFDDTNKRLVRTLLELSHSVAATERGEGVELRITHQELAQKIGAARETVSLGLTQLRQKNLLRTGRNRLSFNRDALESFSQSQAAEAPAASGETDSR